jgi:hypothetical protein
MSLALLARSSRIVVWPVMAALVALACGSDRGGDADSARGAGAGEVGAAASGTSAPVADATGAPPCRLEGDWTPCAVEDRLLHAGVVLDRQADLVRHDFLRVPGTRYHVGSADHQLQVFLYASEADRRRDTDALDSAAASPRGTRVSWPAPPTLVMSQNLAAIILSLNDRTVERLSLALGAGLPQPGTR